MGTGPPYPPSPASGANAIGSFIIGVSPIGDIVPFNYWSTIISQYANSPRLTTLIGNFAQYVDQTANMDLFFDNIWNINSAYGYGLDVWGRIVGVQRILLIVAPGKYLGFEEAGALTVDPFNQSPFFSGGSSTSNYSLSDSVFRQLIFAKAMANISNGSIQSINAILTGLFPNQGNTYVVDGLNMTMEYVFDFPLTPVQIAIVTQSGVLPRPTGVQSTVVQR